MLTEKYVSFSTTLPSEIVMGLGERWMNLDLEVDKTYTIWNKDYPADVHHKTINNTYGYHPVYFAREKSNKWFGVLLRSSMGMDVVYHTLDTGKR